jgi:hypothetical protein
MENQAATDEIHPQIGASARVGDRESSTHRRLRTAGDRALSARTDGRTLSPRAVASAPSETKLLPRVPVAKLCLHVLSPTAAGGRVPFARAGG